MNYYMNVTNFATNDMARKLYQEIAMVEEEHVTHYESLMDPNATWLEMLLWHEYCECYLYWSCLMTETDPYVKCLWEYNLCTEIGHLHRARELLEKYEGKQWQQVIPCGEFPAPISLHENIEYVRKILADTVQYTSGRDNTYEKVECLPTDADFFNFQKTTNPTVQMVPSHNVIDNYLRRHRQDYRFEVAENPIPELRNRREDNTDVGRVPHAANSTDFTCN